MKEIYFTGMLTHGQSDFRINYIAPENHTVRSYHPNFLVRTTAGELLVIEVKANYELGDGVVSAKKDFTERMPKRLGTVQNGGPYPGWGCEGVGSIGAKAMLQHNFWALNQRKIIDILIGDTIFEEKQDYRVQMPYLSGTDLCSLSTKFGLPASYPMGGGALSRWMYMQNLLEHTTREGTTSELLKYLFDLRNFNKCLAGLTGRECIENAHKCIVETVMSGINNELLFLKKELFTNECNFYITETNSPRTIAKRKLTLIDVPYIHDLNRRIESDMASEAYDSVITKSRTMVEEVLLHIIERKNVEGKFSGDILKMYSAVKDSLGMRQDNEKDKRINAMLSGLEKTLQSIAEMRNAQSDAHGAGQKRINIRKHEAQLTVNCAITFSEYIFSVFEFQNNKAKMNSNN